MKQRNHAFDLLCGLCIVRMMSLHAMTFCGHQLEDWWLEVMQWSYFFMSFFFFKAGYFNKSVSGDTREYLKDRCKRLLVPYITTGLIGAAIYFAFLPLMLDRYHNPIEPLTWEHIWITSSFYGNQPTWFLFSFFSAYVIVHFLEKVPHLVWITLTFPAISYGLFHLGNPLYMSLNNVFMGVFFFELGRVWRILMERMGRKRTAILSAILCVAFVVSNIIFHDASYTMSFNTFKGNPVITVLNIICILCGLSGLLISLQLPRVPVISYIGEHSMVYFVGHYPILYIVKFTRLAFGRSIYTSKYDEIILLLPALFIICSWMVPFIERIPWLSGRWPKKKVTDTSVPVTQ